MFWRWLLFRAQYYHLKHNLMNFNTVNHCLTVNASLHRCYVQCYPRDVQDATERCCVVCVPVRRYTVDIYTVSTPRRYLHSPAWISTAPDRELRRKWWTESPCRHSTLPTQQSPFSYFSPLFDFNLILGHYANQPARPFLYDLCSVLVDS